MIWRQRIIPSQISDEVGRNHSWIFYPLQILKTSLMSQEKIQFIVVKMFLFLCQFIHSKIFNFNFHILCCKLESWKLFHFLRIQSLFVNKYEVKIWNLVMKLSLVQKCFYFTKYLSKLNSDFRLESWWRCAREEIA